LRGEVAVSGEAKQRRRAWPRENERGEQVVKGEERSRLSFPLSADGLRGEGRKEGKAR